MVYPSAIDTDTTLYLTANLRETTVTSPMSDTATSLFVSSTAGFPPSGFLRVGNSSLFEFIYYSSTNASSFIGIIRGVDARYPGIAHSSGETVSFEVMSEHHNVLKDAIIAIENTLGLSPQGSYASVKARLDALSSPAPVSATYITKTPETALTNSQALSPLATGLLKNANGTGILSIGVPGLDYARMDTASTWTALQTYGDNQIKVGNLLKGSATLSLPATTDTLVGRSSTDSLANKTITDPSNNVAAKSLFSATTLVDVAASPAPSVGQVLMATDSTHAVWSTPSTSSGVPWVEVTSTSTTMAPNTGYVSSNPALVTLTLPVTIPFGSIFRVLGKGAGGWKIAQNAGQQILWEDGNVNGVTQTSTGTGGYIVSDDTQDSVELVCTTANTILQVLSSKGEPILT